jgi:hypothetical protein
MKVQTSPPNHNIRSHQEALKMLTITGGRVLIWGSFEKATRSGKELRGFSTISFTFNTLPLEVVDKAEILADSLVGRRWGWEIDNSVDKSVVAANLAEVARYVVGLSLLGERRYSEAQPILALLHLEMRSKYGSKRVPAPVDRFQETLKRAYIISLVEEVGQLYHNEVYEERLFSVDSRTLSQWERKIRDAIGLDEHIPKARLLLAIIEFLKGDIEASRRLLCEERQRFATSRAACDFSEAFLATFSDNYRDAKKIYKRVTRDPRATEPKFLQPILSFLEQAAVKYPEKPGLLFIIGLVNHELNDSLRARTAFEEFAARGQGKDSLSRWLREADLRIQRITSEMSKEPLDR